MLPAASAHLAGGDPAEVYPAKAVVANLGEALLREKVIDQSLSWIVITYCFRCCSVLVLGRSK
jgi:hypothetical protein